MGRCLGESSMKKLFVAGLAFVSLTAFANPYNFKITRVIDGDTVAFQADFLPAPLKPELIDSCSWRRYT
jgi:hypothetical protein